MRSDRMLAATGAVYVVAMVVGNALTQGGNDVRDGSAALTALRHGRTTAQSVGAVLGPISIFALLVFIGHLYRVLRAAERPAARAATAALGAGLVMTAVDVASAMPSVAAVLGRDWLTPSLLRTLHALNDAGFVISGYVFGIFVVLAAASAFTSRVLPRWLAGGGLVVGVLALVAGLAGIVDPDGYVPVPFLLCLVWVVLTSLLLAVRGPLAGADLDHGTAKGVPMELPTTA
jgi:uncharacterized protein DUF4386